MTPTLFDEDATGPGTTAGPVAALLGRCPRKGCAARARVMLPDTKRERTIGRYPFEYDAPALVLPIDPRPGGARPMTGPELARFGMLPHCVEHRRPLSFEPVRGTYSDGRACDTRCMGATGPNCECRCAGANHGGRWG